MLHPPTHFLRYLMAATLLAVYFLYRYFTGRLDLANILFVISLVAWSTFTAEVFGHFRGAGGKYYLVTLLGGLFIIALTYLLVGLG